MTRFARRTHPSMPRSNALPAGQRRCGPPRRSFFLLLIAGGSLGLCACRSHAVGTSGDAGGDGSDAALSDAAAPPADGAVGCGAPALAMGFVWQTPVPATHPSPGVEEIEITGVARYHGPITVPIAQNPAFDREVQIEHPGGQVSVVQYFLPQDLRLPVEQGEDYVIFVRRLAAPDGSGVGLLVSRATSGLPPLLFVGDAGPLRVFTEEDPRLTPLKVYREPDPQCAPGPDPLCGGQIFEDQLRFDSSTGGATIEVVARQGESAPLTIFGEPFLVLNLESMHRDPPCPDQVAERAVYLAGTETMTRRACAPERFRVWDNPAPDLGAGDWCDELLFCATLDQAVAAGEVAPDVTCDSPTMMSCAPGELECRFPTDTPITEAVYDEMCAVSVLENPPEIIQCQVYFD